MARILIWALPSLCDRHRKHYDSVTQLHYVVGIFQIPHALQSGISEQEGGELCTGVCILVGDTDKWRSRRAGENNENVHIREAAVDDVTSAESSFGLSAQQACHCRSR